MMKGVLFLLPLKDVLEEKLSLDFRCASDAYLAAIRDVEDHVWSEGAVGASSSQTFRPPDNFAALVVMRREERRKNEAEELKPIASQHIRLVKVEGCRLKDRLEIGRLQEIDKCKSFNVTSRSMRRKVCIVLRLLYCNVQKRIISDFYRSFI